VNARTRSLNLAPSVYSLLLCRLTQPAGQTFLLSFKEPINRNSTREAGTEWKEGIEAVRMVSLSLSQSINLLSTARHMLVPRYALLHISATTSLCLFACLHLYFFSASIFLALLQSFPSCVFISHFKSLSRYRLYIT